MKKITAHFKNKSTIFLSIIILSILLRFAYLNILPNGINGDELDYMLNAKAYFETGKDLIGVTSPLSVLLFHYPPTNMPQAELPYLLLLPIVGPFGFSLFLSRVIYAVASVSTVILLYFIAKKIFNQQAALFTAFIAAINPWFIFVGRTAYEADLAVPFYLAGFYMLLAARKWKLLWSLPFFILAFYSYIGTKLIFIPFILLSILYSFFVVHKKQFLKQYLVLFFVSLAFVIFFFIALKHFSPTPRLSEIYTPSSPDIALQVNDIRKQSITNPLLSLFENKMTVYLRVIINRFFDVFSANYLFTSGDTFFSLWRIGLFYYLDALFILMGSIFLFQKNKIILLFLSLFIVIGTFPQIFHSGSGNFTPHIALLFPFLMLLIGYGIWSSINALKNNYKKWTTIILIGCYVVLLGNFVNIYFFEFPLQGYFDFSTRTLSYYISLTQQSNSKVVVNTRTPDDTFKKYIYYTNRYNEGTKNAIKKALQTKQYVLNNVSFVPCSKNLVKNAVTIYNSSCKTTFTQNKNLTIARLADAGWVYQIYNDQICSKYSLQSFPSQITLRDFTVESMDEKKFCTTYITNLQ